MLGGHDLDISGLLVAARLVGAQPCVCGQAPSSKALPRPVQAPRLIPREAPHFPARSHSEALEFRAPTSGPSGDTVQPLRSHRGFTTATHGLNTSPAVFLSPRRVCATSSAPWPCSPLGAALRHLLLSTSNNLCIMVPHTFQNVLQTVRKSADLANTSLYQVLHVQTAPNGHRTPWLSHP